jgi:hypothetical protein
MAPREQTDRVVGTGNPFLDPLVALAALGLIVLICRWVFSTDHRVAPPAPKGRPDYGLLEPVTIVRTREDAAMLCGVLRDAGIRGTVTETDGAFAVLVFRADAVAARSLVRSA